MGKAARARRKKGGLADAIRFLFVLFLFALFVRSFLIAPFMIPTRSMLPRLLIGDYLFVAKWPYGYSRYSLPFGLFHFDGRALAGEPRRGDVVVFHYPGNGNEDYVKRVIGLPGDTVEMRNGGVWLNGKAVPRVRIADFLVPVTANSPCHAVDRDAERIVDGPAGKRACAYIRYRETLPDGRSYEVLDQIDGPGDDTPPITVPEGHYFVMGDNRDDSEDSRFPVDVGGVGFLPAENLIGRAFIIFFSTDGSASWANPASWIGGTRWDRIGTTFQ